MKKLMACLLVLYMSGCKEVYNPPVKPIETGYLVVEGVINTGSGGTNITLSRTTKLDSRQIAYEPGAAVKLEGDDNSLYTFIEKTTGHYVADTLPLNNTKKYRLHIITATNKEYLSDFAAVNNNPVIDSISLRRENDNGLQLYINTHDALNNTRYYQWYFDETWEIHSPLTTSLKYLVTASPSGNIYSAVYRRPDHGIDFSVYTCWQYDTLASLLLGSTAKLSKDIVYLPLQFIPNGDIKLSVLYSIKIKQYSWQKEGYEFLEKMKKNTESTGSIFDAQPSEIKGNIHCISNPDEAVIGFVNICPVQEQRFFIKREDVPNWNYRFYCNETEIENNSDSIIKKAITLFPTNPVKTFPPDIIFTFLASDAQCVDCTLRGTNTKPSYWP